MRIFLLILFIIFSYSIFADLTDDIIANTCNDKNLSNEQVFLTLSEFSDYNNNVTRSEIISKKTKTDRPFYFYIPQNYNSNSSIPLFVWLHGGVNRPEYIDAEAYINETGLLKFAENLNFALLFPLAKEDCVWWNNTGEKNILEQIKYMKTHYNIDDDRVYLSGFSDGGSGSFHFGFKLPDTFAAFYPLNGMISVSAYMTGNPSFLPNLKNRFLRVVNTDQDGLYPAERTKMTMDLAISAGANIDYREYWGYGHDWGYFDKDMPLLLADMDKRARDSFHSNIYWETYPDNYNSCDWLEILEIDTTAVKKTWQKEYNVKLPDSSISFGFYNDEEFKGEGVQIKSIVENSLAEEMGMQREDIIYLMDNNEVLNIDDLTRLKNTKKRGDDVSITILRNGETKILEGAFPDTAYYNAFFYNRKSGAVRGYCLANTFHLETSRVNKFIIKISPKMVNLDIPVKVIVNGITKFNDMIDYNRNYIKQGFRENKDRKTIWVNYILIQ